MQLRRQIAHRNNIDSAFLRRIQVLAKFQQPAQTERVKIWERLLPANRHEDIDIEALGRTFAVSGGDIRNAVMTATVLSCDAGEAVSLAHLVPAVCRELRKSGRLIDPNDFGALGRYLRTVPSS